MGVHDVMQPSTAIRMLSRHVGATPTVRFFPLICTRPTGVSCKHDGKMHCRCSGRSHSPRPLATAAQPPSCPSRGPMAPRCAAAGVVRSITRRVTRVGSYHSTAIRCEEVAHIASLVLSACSPSIASIPAFDKLEGRPCALHRVACRHVVGIAGQHEQLRIRDCLLPGSRVVHAS